MKTVDNAASTSASTEKDEATLIEDLLKNERVEVEPVYYAINNHSGGGGGGGGQSSTSSTSNNNHNHNSNNSNSNKQLKRGKAYRLIETNEYACFVAYDGRIYKPGDCVYVDSQRTDQPYFIAGVQGFKMTKRDQLNVSVKWYYRPCEVPETVYRSLVQDRHSENASTTTFCLKDPQVQSRELFISDAIDTYPISAIRGKCTVHHLKDICTTARETTKKLHSDDAFFYVLGYNPENNRLASIQGEIRIGSNHQARLPEYRRGNATEPPPVVLAEEEERVWETLIWTPDMLVDGDILMYLRAARSMAAFAGMYDGGSTDNGCAASSKDQTTINAYDTLHLNSYDTGRALQELVKNPLPTSPDKKWTEEETKKFIRGLKQYGKNFFKIRNELLNHKQTSDLIEFYYLWKKTTSANSQRPRQRQRRPQTTNILRRVKPAPNSANSKPSRPASSEFLDLSSASENECESDDSDVKDLSGYACHHCFTTSSKNWHHAGKDRALMCADCRTHFKKYGELRPVDRSRTPPHFLFTPVKETSAPVEGTAANGGVKTRRSGKAGSVGGSRRKTATPTENSRPASTAKSPAADAFDADNVGKSPKPKSSSKKRKPPQDESATPQKLDNAERDNVEAAKKKIRTTTNSENASSVDSSSSSSSTASSGGHEADTETTRDNSASQSGAASPAPAAGPTQLIITPQVVDETVEKLFQEKYATAEEERAVSNDAQARACGDAQAAACSDAQTAACIDAQAPPTRAEKNVYSFREDETLAQSLGQFRRHAQQQQPNTQNGPPAAAAVPHMQVAQIGPVPIQIGFPPMHAEEQRATPSSVIKENKFGAAVKCELFTAIKAEPTDEAAANMQDEEQGEGLFDRSTALPTQKEPDAKIDDTECHRSTFAIFRRHLYRGESNSCSRTDLVFIPKPDSSLAKKREESLRAKNAVVKEEPKAQVQQQQKEQRPTSSNNSRSSSTALANTQFALPSPHQQQNLLLSRKNTPTPSTVSAFQQQAAAAVAQQDLPFLARLKEYATAAAQTAPGTAAFYQAAILDPVLQSRILSGVYGPVEKERLEMELRERQQEALQRDYELATKAIFPCSSSSVVGQPQQQCSSVAANAPDARQWLGAAGFGPFSPATSAAMGLLPQQQQQQMLPPGFATMCSGMDAATSDRILATLSAERHQLERMMATNPNPWLRVEFERISAQLAAFAGATQHHTHSHTHSHTHLHIHPSTGIPISCQESAAASTLAPTIHPMWTPGPPMNPEALMLQYAMMRPAVAGGFMDFGAGAFPQFPGVPPPGFGFPPQTGLDPLAAERLQQLQQQEMHRRMLIERDQIFASQQQAQAAAAAAVQHNEMMRRLQQEGGVVGLMNAGVIRPSPSPFDKR